MGSTGRTRRSEIIDGQAAFNVMGDWAEASFAEAGFEAPTDYVYFPVPGTDGVNKIVIFATRQYRKLACMR